MRAYEIPARLAATGLKPTAQLHAEQRLAQQHAGDDRDDDCRW
jgi:hypothetical protein